MANPIGQFRVGTSGYLYDHWRGQLYPERLSRRFWFAHYAKHFDSVEMNNTFYRLPSPEVFDAWRKQAPPEFCYALKFSRYGSHVKRLKDARAVIKRFLLPARRLRGVLGPILVQLPPHWSVNPARLQEFFRAAPRSLRWVFEFRDPSWLCEEVFAILERNNSALCIHDMIEDHPRRITTNWIYLRFHGVHYRSCYSPEQLKTQARWIEGQLGAGKDVFAFFNNDAEGHAVRNAIELKNYVGA